MTGDGLGAPPRSRNEWEDERRTLTEVNRMLRSELEHQANRIKELEEALQPFRKSGERLLVPCQAKTPDEFTCVICVTIGHLRRAAKALETPK